LLEEIATAWDTCVRLAKTVDSIKTFNTDDREEFDDAFKSVFDYWSAATMPRVIQSASETLISLNANGMTNQRIEQWTRSHAQEHLGTFLLERTRTGSFPSFSTTVDSLNASLSAAFRSRVC